MIPIIEEPIEIRREFGSSRERCCFCREPTIHWTKLPERTPGEQVAICPGCGEIHSPEEVPPKSEWTRKEREISRSEGRLRS